MAGRGTAAGTGGAVALQIGQFQFQIERVEREEKSCPERRVVVQPKQTSSHGRAAMPVVGQRAIEGRMSGWPPEVMTMDCAFQLSTLALSDMLRPQPVKGIASCAR